jgi:hypothetical protein
MNFEYHRKTLIASDSNHPMVNEALTMLDVVEKAMKDLVNGLIDIKEYINAITPYDQFMYERAKMKPQKSNPINTLQNKKYSTWREQKWAPIWELIRIEMSETWKTSNLITIQNKQIVESIYSSGYIKYKDVDGGISFEFNLNGKKVLFPIVAVEDKGGHACSTCFDGVSAQSLRLHRCLPNAFHVFITDNNISVGKDKESETFCDIDLIVSERGQNRKTEKYPKLNADRFQEVKDGIISRLKKVSIDHFKEFVAIQSKKNGKFRNEIDQSGIIWNR